ncbi:elongation factor G [Skermanella rosea]|uniref:elongation factor G n=1 Tax=Skermanella rosea TaxID=1817965 RepID=UPI0019341241|nr:elongation factor G [Skermanella rosea]UEM04970.1 elongation factor G [Skermanella rosea]
MSRSTQLDRYRNIGIMAHIDAGRTTTTERILYYTGRSGKPAETTAASGADAAWAGEDEERGITITSAATTCFWNGHRINIIDTPSHVDLPVEVERTLRVIDGALAVFDAAVGIEPQSEAAWRRADQHRVPRLCFVNKMDRPGADFFRTIGMLADRVGATPLLLQLPIGGGDGFRGVVDLLGERALVWQDDGLGASFQETGIPADLEAQVAEYRAKLVEAAVQVDTEAAEAFLAGTVPDVAALKALIRRGTCAAEFVPVLCGSAFRNKGIQPVLDAIVDYLPSPADIGGIRGTEGEGRDEAVRPADDAAPFSALVFKVMSDPVAGSLAFARVYSGTQAVGGTVLNPLKGEREKIGRMLQMQATAREDVKQAIAGDIIAFAGLKHTATGDTLCDPSHPIVLERTEFPEPLIEVTVEPRTGADAEKMAAALRRMAQEDPSFAVAADKEPGRTVLRGAGELQLEILADRLKREFKVDAKVGGPRVAYRETVSQRAEVDHTHRKQVGGASQFARVRLAVEPAASASGVRFESRVAFAVLPKEFVQAVEKGVEAAGNAGVVAGFPVTDVAVSLLDGARHDIDSSALAFELAGAAAFRDALGKAGPVLLEPVMSVDIVTPADFAGGVIGDLRSRRGRIEQVDQRGDAAAVTALVPLANLFGYANILRSISQGRAHHTMQFDHYEPVPQAIADEVRARVA